MVARRDFFLLALTTHNYQHPGEATTITSLLLTGAVLADRQPKGV